MVRKRYLFMLFIFICLSMVFLIKPTFKAKTKANDDAITLLLDWYISEDQAPILLADIQGTFKKYHLNVKLVELSDPSLAPKLIASHQADLAISYGGSYWHQLKQGLPVKQVGTLIDRPLNCLMYLPQSGIHSPKDLEHKRVGFTDPNDDFLLLKTVLKAGGLSLQDVNLINIQSTLTQSLMLGKIDIATDMLRNVEPILMKHKGFSVSMFCPEDFNVPNYPELIFIAHADAQSSKINRFLRAIKEASLFIEQHPENAWEELKTAYPKFNTEIHKEIWQETYPLFSKKA